jgi:hypothetical protein
LYHALFGDARFLAALLGIDQGMAAEAKAAGCDCGGVLHRGDYPRKPRGGPEGLGVEYGRRLSFCCAEEGCRKRRTPPSVRFLGRRVYWAVVVVLGAAFEGGVTAGRFRRLRELIGGSIDRRTLTRWVVWWRETLPKSRAWKALTGLFFRSVAPGRMPLSLLELVSEDDAAMRVTRVLGLLSEYRTDQAM